MAEILDKFGRRIQLSPVDEAIAQRVTETIIEISRAGKTRETAREIAISAFVWADHLVWRYESESPLPRPIVCQAGCNFCCYNQVELTPPEALSIGYYIDRNFSEDEKIKLLARVERSISLKSGKSKKEIGLIRRQLPCPLLRDKECGVYRVRPLLCRAMHSLDARQCELDLHSQSLTSFEYYLHRYEIINSVIAGLQDGCQALGCQSRPVDLLKALKDFCQHERPAERWLRGEKIFSPLSP